MKDNIVEFPQDLNKNSKKEKSHLRAVRGMFDMLAKEERGRVVAEEIEKYLSRPTLVTNKSDTVPVISIDRIKTESKRNLIMQAIKSTEADWSNHRREYLELAQELKKRLGPILTNNPDDDSDDDPDKAA